MDCMCEKSKLIFKFQKKLEAMTPGYDAVVLLLPRDNLDERRTLIDRIAKQLKEERDWEQKLHSES